MSRFSDRLWRDLVREHGPDLAQMESLSKAGHRRRARPRVLAGTGMGVAVIATAAVLILGAASSSPAFAVTRNHDGSYSVRVETWTAIPAANRLLRGMGVPAQVVAVSTACGTVSQTLRLTRAGSGTPAALIRARLLARQARIDPRRIPAGKKLMITAWRVGRQVRVMAATVVSVAPACMTPPCAVGIVPPPAPSDSGAVAHASVSASSNAQVSVPVIVRQRLVRLAKLAAKRCAKPGAGAPAPAINR